MKKLVTFFVIALLIVLPIFVFAQEQTDTVGIPCDGPDCTFASLMQLISNILRYLVYLSIPLATIAFAWAGGIMVMSGGSESKKDEAKEIFTKVLIGFVFVLTAWLIVNTITKALLDDARYTNLLNAHPVYHIYV